MGIPGQNGKWAKWEEGEMGRGQNGKMAKWQWGEMAMGRNGKGQNDKGQDGKGRNGNKPIKTATSTEIFTVNINNF
jgi:hypothetical protein